MKPYSITVFIRHFGWGIYLPLAIIWPLQHGLNLAQIGIITAILLIVQLSVEIPTGALADRFGKTRSIIAGSVLHVLGAAAFAFAGGFASFLVSGILMGAGWSLISGADEAYMYDVVQETGEESKYKTFLSKISLADETGTLVGFLASSFIIWRFSEQTALITTSVILVLSTAYGAFALKEPKLSKEELVSVSDEVTAMRKATEFARRHRYFLALAVFLAFLYESGRMLWQPQLLHLGFVASQISLIYALLGLFSVAGAYVAGHKRIKSSLMTMLLLGMAQVACFLLFSRGTIVISLLGIGAYLFVEKISRVIQTDVVNGAIKSNYRATFLSIKNLNRSGAGVIFALVLGSVATRSIPGAFYVLAGIDLIGVLGLGILLSRHTKEG